MSDDKKGKATRLRAAFHSLGLRYARDLANLLEIDDSQLNRAANAKGWMSVEKLMNLEKKTGISWKWIQEGEGDMYVPGAARPLKDKGSLNTEDYEEVKLVEVPLENSYWRNKATQQEEYIKGLLKLLDEKQSIINDMRNALDRQQEYIELLTKETKKAKR